MLLSPWVHAFHGRVGLAFASLGMRAVGPLVGALVGGLAYCATTDDDRGCGSRGVAWGLIGGLVVTATADVALMSYERTPRTQPATDVVVHLAPYIAPLDSGLAVGLAGHL